MNLGELRKWIADTTGRLDLVTSAYGDNGLDIFIKAGQRLLDRKFPAAGANMRFFQELKSGEYLVKMKSCRFVKEVWVNDAEERIELDKKTWNEIRKIYSGSDLSQVSSGTPRYYGMVGLGLSPELQGYTSATNPFSYGTGEILFGDEGEFVDYKGLIVLPPPDTTVTVEVLGSFFYEFLSDSTETFWSANYPELCLMATQWAIELTWYRNTSGAWELERSIDEAIRELDFDLVEHEIAQVIGFE